MRIGIQATIVAAALALLLAAAPAPDGGSYPGGEAVLTSLNAMRAQPARYAAGLDAISARFDATQPLLYREPGDPVGRLTNEGARAVTEASTALRATPPLPAITFSPLLAKAARAHVEAQGPSGATGHVSGGRGPGDRVTALGGQPYVAETISYGTATSEEVVRQLIVDDGVVSRGHRRTLLSRDYRFVGIWCGFHARWRSMCVLDFSTTATGAYAPPS